MRLFSYFEITLMKTPHSLFLQGLERITKILIDNGAIIDAQDDDGETPLENAASYGNLQAHKREQMSCLCEIKFS